MEEASIPIYFNWSFWAVVAAFIAIILSQLPPIRLWFKKANLEAEIYSKIAITHKVGNPNLQLHLLISNVGGRKIRIKDISGAIERDGKPIVTLPAQNYLQNQNDKDTLLFTPFSLKPDEEWAHILNLLNFFNRGDENEYRALEARMLADFREKRAQLKEEPKDPIEIDEALVEQCNQFFDRHFIWNTGEYLITINISTNQDSANISKKYRFTVFDAHAEQLKEITGQFKFGGGVWWTPNMPINISLDIKEA